MKSLCKRLQIIALLSCLLAISDQEGYARECDVCDSRCCCRNSEGTLFRWSRFRASTGGPDLDEALVTDRPDFTEASSTVGLGVVQIEFGYTFSLDDDGQTRNRGQSWGEPLLRYGILHEWLELRVGLFPVTESLRQGVSRDSTSGTEDLYLGFKLGLTPQAGWYPEMAIVPQMTVPTGSTAFTNNEVLPGVNWVYGWELSDDFSTAGSTQFNRSRDGSGESYMEWAQSWTLAASLTERWGSYAEWFAFFPHSSVDAKPQHVLNGGLTFLICDDVQWDVRAGFGLSDEADDFFCGTGLSIRFR